MPSLAADLDIAPLDAETLQQARHELRGLRLEPSLIGYISEIARRTRNWPSVSLGASPRAAISLMLVAKALAALADRDYVIPDDVKAAVLPAMRHRIVLRPEAELEGLDTDRVLTDVLAAVEVPK
jgi:MoxR-like ATPase